MIKIIFYILTIVILIYICLWIVFYRVFGYTRGNWPAINNNIPGEMKDTYNCFENTNHYKIEKIVNIVFSPINNYYDIQSFKKNTKIDLSQLINSGKIEKNAFYRIAIIHYSYFYQKHKLLGYSEMVPMQINVVKTN